MLDFMTSPPVEAVLITAFTKECAVGKKKGQRHRKLSFAVAQRAFAVAGEKRFGGPEFAVKKQPRHS
jgi:hypothetical protein